MLECLIYSEGLDGGSGETSSAGGVEVVSIGGVSAVVAASGAGDAAASGGVSLKAVVEVASGSEGAGSEGAGSAGGRDATCCWLAPKTFSNSSCVTHVVPTHSFLVFSSS